MNTKLLRNNLLVLLGYTILSNLFALTENNGASMVIAIFMMFAVGIHVGVLVIGAIVQQFSNKDRSAGGQWLLNALLIGVIGFGTCWGSATLAEAWGGPINIH